MDALKIILQILLAAIVVGLGIWIVVSIFSDSVDSPDYQVTEKKGAIEVRTYSSFVIAQTPLEGVYREALNSGFRLLANYIFGNNQQGTSIAMTAPVLHTSSSSLVYETEMKDHNNPQIMAFVMPDSYSLKTLPEPVRRSIQFLEIPESRVATIRFNGYATPKRNSFFYRKLKVYLDQTDFDYEDSMMVAQYNSPWRFPLLRRNEIWIRLR